MMKDVAGGTGGGGKDSEGCGQEIQEEVARMMKDVGRSYMITQVMLLGLLMWLLWGLFM